MVGGELAMGHLSEVSMCHWYEKRNNVPRQLKIVQLWLIWTTPFVAISLFVAMAMQVSLPLLSKETV